MTNLPAILTQKLYVPSVYLKREVHLDIYLPAIHKNGSVFNLLLINDGQDMEKMKFASILENGYQQKEVMQPLLCVGIHAGPERKREYGIAGHPDYKERGDRAGVYTSFILEELLAFIYNKYPGYSYSEKAFAGFSLGALSSMDIVWNHPEEFCKAGCFSPSFWWRNLDQHDPGYNDDKHRIMHQLIRNGKNAPSLKFFFQCGNKDETKDRNKNGIIDSIDDTLDLIKELVAKGYDLEKEIRYLEIQDGHHDVYTWGRAMPEFLKWGWGRSK
ncbi:MAG TPA: alpha/beta hydrolase-fold protein [Chitinophagaceae bacterium]|nr:alpha/beta hydrolase-fold protein [Chitinophagaceae bacterium]